MSTGAARRPGPGGAGRCRAGRPHAGLDPAPPPADNSPMTDTDLHAQAMATFAVLFDEAAAAGEPDRTAMTVARLATNTS